MNHANIFTAFSPSVERIHLATTQDIEIALDFELKLLQMYGPSLAIYALPNFNDPLVWNGIIFVRHGCYKDAKFKFNLHLHGFPKLQPKLFFTSNLHHPLVDEVSGQCDVTSLLTDDWNYGTDNMLYNLMSDLQSMFIDKKKLMNKQSYNPSAAEFFEENSHQFIARAMKSVNLSLQNINIDQDGCTLRILSQIQTGQSLKIKKEIELVTGLQASVDEKIELFIKRLSNDNNQ